MKRLTFIFLILFFKTAFIFGQAHKSFNIKKVKEQPVLKSLTSASNTLYVGIDNVFVLQDTLMAAKKYIITSTGANMLWSGNKLFLKVTVYNADTILIVIRKVAGGKDTLVLNCQKMAVKKVPNVWCLTLGGSVVKDTISKAKLLQYKKLGICITPDIIGIDTHIMEFDMQIANNTFHSGSNALTPEMIKALQYSVMGTSIIFSKMKITGTYPMVIANHQVRLIQ